MYRKIIRRTEVSRKFATVIGQCSLAMIPMIYPKRFIIFKIISFLSKLLQISEFSTI